jgi:hypothetical protein
MPPFLSVIISECINTQRGIQMRFYEIQQLLEAKQLGRAFNHLEDLVFFHGVSGTIEALDHLKDVATQEGSKSIRMKWDGSPQVYWGREVEGGPLILAGHNGWGKGAKTSNPAELEDFIANGSGNPKTPEEKANRDAFAKEFASLYPLFDAATPKDFVGFVYADSLFLQRPQVKDGVYTFCPNPKSKTCYHVRQDSDLGKRISQAEVMVVGHAYFPEFGMPDNEQQPISDFSQFDKTTRLIVQGPVYNSKPVSVDTSEIDAIEKYARDNANRIDGFLEPVKGLSDLKNIMYTYVNQTSRAEQLDHLSEKHFFDWLSNSKVSANKQTKIAELNDYFGNSVDAIITLLKRIQDVKDNVIDQVEGEQGEIWDTNGEGRVRYADANKKHGNVKFVPRKKWHP